MTLPNALLERGIREVLHFTTNKGLVGMLATGSVKSRRRLPKESYLKHILHPNSKVRSEDSAWFDKVKDWLDFVNLSVSEINTSFFNFSSGWEHNQDLWWAILSFDPEAISHDGVFFATTNNAYEHCRRQSGLTGFESIFAPAVRRKGSWLAKRGSRAAHLPTCEQAEVLYPCELSLALLRRIYVRRDEDRDCVKGWLIEFEREGVDVIVSPAKFLGAPN